MVSIKTFLSIGLGTAIFAAQTINIRGTVVDTAGIGIPGANVNLENAGMSATTGADGSFTLEGMTGIKTHSSTGSLSSPINFQNNTIKISLSENAQVSVYVYDIGGRRITASKRTFDAGKHAIPLSLQSTGVYPCKITVGQKARFFKAVPLGFLLCESNKETGTNDGFTFAQHAKSSAIMSDIIFIKKEGRLDYRDSMRTSDTSGMVIKMIPNAGDVTDKDGNVYQSVRIGNQVWTVENLRVTKYNDGTVIPFAKEDIQWAGLGTPGYCYYNNATNADTIEKWGALYNWYVGSTTNPKQIAPEGWRVPTDADWDTLQNYLIANGYNGEPTRPDNTIAKALAARTDWTGCGTAGATGNNASTNNASGFSALPGGFRGVIGTFTSLRSDGSWWSASEYTQQIAYSRHINYNSGKLDKYNSSEKCGFSVRLVRN